MESVMQVWILIMVLCPPWQIQIGSFPGMRSNGLTCHFRCFDSGEWNSLWVFMVMGIFIPHPTLLWEREKSMEDMWVYSSWASGSRFAALVYDFHWVSLPSHVLFSFMPMYVFLFFLRANSSLIEESEPGIPLLGIKLVDVPTCMHPKSRY